MITIYNSKLARIILLQNFSSVMLFGIIFTVYRRGELSERDINHEKIHVAQWCEVSALSTLIWSFLMFAIDFWYMWTLPLCFVVYYIIYVAEYAIRRLYGGESNNRDYRHIGFEKEAYKHQKDMGYLSSRKPFAWINYVIE